MIVYGLKTTSPVLARKMDLCTTCGVAGMHFIVRRARWVEIFFVPVIPIWVNHRLVCGNCAAETKLGFGQVRRALSTGKMPLAPRPNFAAYANAQYDAGERRPSESEFDKVEKNPDPGGWATLLKVWPVIAVTFVVAVVILVNL